MQGKVAHRFLPALESLRGIAALSVAAAHGLVVLYSGPLFTPLVEKLASFAGFGMTLFFVLSGFVIHYNYHSGQQFTSVEKIKFFIARFARLYPLFITLFLLELFYNCTIKENCGDRHLGISLGFFLTFTQSWFYSVIDGRSLVSQFWSIGGISWSLSVEWFFYIVYAFFGYWLFRLSSKRKIFCAALIIYTIFASILVSASEHYDAIVTWGMDHSPALAPSVTVSDSLFRWLVYFCPLMRLGEFMLGALAAHAYIRNSTKEYSSVFPLAFLLFGSVIIIHILSWYMPVRQNVVPQLYAPLVALLMYVSVKSPKDFFVRVLHLKPLLLIGKYSYSIYLLHCPLLLIAARLNAHMNMPASVLYIVSLSSIFLVSALIYNFFERPSNQIVRRKLNSWLLKQQ